MKRPSLSHLREWYRKAEAAGFRDLETRNADGLLRTDVRTDEASVLVREGPARAEYYRLARQFLHEHKFVIKEDRNIWALHAEGASVWDAARQLKLPHTRVQRAVERLAEIMLTPHPRCGRPPANEQQHGRQQWNRGVRLSDHETEAMWFIAMYSNVAPVDAIRLAILAYAKAIRLSARTNPGTPVPKKGGTE